MEKIFKQNWWKVIGVLLLLYVIIGGLLVPLRTPEIEGIAFPNLAILNESIRNLLFHVPMWFSMVLILLFSFIQGIVYLAKGDIKNDIFSSSAAKIGLVFGMCGITTGMMWARHTWGAYWPPDPKLNGALVGVLIYFAYLILRGSIKDEVQKAKVSAVYNIFAFVIFILFIFVLPRLSDASLHPGVGGNPAFGKYDLDNNLRLFFYPAVIGWAILGFWIVSLNARIEILKLKMENEL